MNPNTSGEIITCDFPNCQLEGLFPSTIYDDDGEDQGVEMFCHHHRQDRLTDDDRSYLQRFFKPTSALVEITNPLKFEDVSRLVKQTEALNNIQNNIRSHRSI